MDAITDKDILLLIKDTLGIDEDINLNSRFNAFEYDSFEKINLILLIESFSAKRIDINKFLSCETFSDLVELVKKQKELSV